MIAIVIIIHRGLARKPNSSLQNDATLFILPVHFNHFSYFIANYINHLAVQTSLSTLFGTDISTHGTVYRHQ